MDTVYEQAKRFKTKYPMTVAWRIKQHCKIINKHLNPGEEVLYTFAAQKNDNPFDIWTSCVVALTNKRIMIAQKRVVFGWLFTTITPDLYNDLKVNMGFIWGKVYVDTVKELVCFSNIQRDALSEIETEITEYMMKQKKEYKIQEEAK
jgi:hypothetical protein